MNKRQTYTNTPAAIGPERGKSVWATPNNNNNKAGKCNACQGPPFFLAPQQEALPQEGAWNEEWLIKENSMLGKGMRGVTSGPAQASVGVKSSTHTAINTYSANMQEAAKKKYLNQRFKTSPLQRHQSASIVKTWKLRTEVRLPNSFISTHLFETV